MSIKTQREDRNNNYFESKTFTVTCLERPQSASHLLQIQLLQGALNPRQKLSLKTIFCKKHTVYHASITRLADMTQRCQSAATTASGGISFHSFIDLGRNENCVLVSALYLHELLIVASLFSCFCFFQFHPVFYSPYPLPHTSNGQNVDPGY